MVRSSAWTVQRVTFQMINLNARCAHLVTDLDVDSHCVTSVVRVMLPEAAKVVQYAVQGNSLPLINRDASHVRTVNIKTKKDLSDARDAVKTLGLITTAQHMLTSASSVAKVSFMKAGTRMPGAIDA